MQTSNVFIVGCARTGTSLLREILNRSPHICIAPETHYLHRLSSAGHRAQKIKRIGDLTNDRSVDAFVDYVYTSAKISTYWQWLKRTVDRQCFRQRILDSDRSERAVFLLLMQIFAEETGKIARETLILGEKTPAHLHYVPQLLEWFPQAKVIHTFRDPRAITVSRIRKVRKNQVGLRSTFPSAPEWLLRPLDTPVEMLRMSKAWFNAVKLHTRYEQLYARRYLLVRFEDLIIEPERQVAQICEFLAIPFERELLSEVVVVGSSYHTRQRGPSGFDKQTLDRWKSKSPLIRAWYSTVARNQLKRFGYAP